MTSQTFKGQGASRNDATHHSNSAQPGAFFMGCSMLKKLLIGATIILGLAGHVQAAGTIPGFSLTPQIDSNGVPLIGCQLYIIQAGTTSTPQNGYSDSGLTLPLPNPVTCDGYGRLPQIFVADGNIKVRLTKANGVQVFTQDGILVIGASSGGGGGSPVDATTILATGDMKARYGTGALTGFVRANGRTIGSATSGASERANADCQALFEYLWGADANLTVSTGRGASANADWLANKTIALPDWRGRALAFLDDMGNSAAGRLTATYFGTSGTVLGAAGGAESKTLLTANLPPYTPAGTNTGGAASFTYSVNSMAAGANTTVNGLSATGLGTTVITNFTQPTFTGTPQGGTSTPVSAVQPTMLATVYLKL